MCIRDSVKDRDLPFLGRDIYGQNMGGPNDPQIEEKINSLIKYACQKAYEVIINNESAFLDIIKLLKEERTINGDQIDLILGVHHN